MKLAASAVSVGQGLNFSACFDLISGVIGVIRRCILAGSVVRKELRTLTEAYMRRERIDHHLQPNALVHEAYMKLVQQHSIDWQSRANFSGLLLKSWRGFWSLTRADIYGRSGVEGRGWFQLMRAWRLLPNNLESFSNWTRR